MKIFVVGASGYIGNAVARAFAKEGHEVIGLCNSLESEKKLIEQGINAVVGDMGNPNTWMSKAATADVIVHAAHLRAGMRLSSAWLKRSTELRDTCLNAIVKMMKVNPSVKTLIYTSGMIAHGNHGDKVIDEMTIPNYSALGNYHLGGEKIISGAVDQGVSALSIRPGMVYGNGGTFKKFFLDVAAKGKYQFPGNGENFIPFIHIDDLAKAYVAVATSTPTGLNVINVVDDNPIKMKDMAQSLLGAMGGGKHSSVPAWLVSLFAGKALSEMLVGSYRVKNHRVKKAFDWEPIHPSFDVGIKQVVAEYRR